jgi:V/A-type H+-transporting ATPase subunit I
MAIVEMQKVRMAIHKSISDELIDKIQRLGCCQFIPFSHEEADEQSLSPLRSRLRRIEDQLAEARFILRFLDPFATEKGGGLAKALGDIEAYSLGQLESLASDEKFDEASEILRTLEKKLADAKSGASRASGLIAQLSPLSELPYSLDFYSKGTEKIAGSLISVPSSNVSSLKSNLSSLLGDMAEFFELPAGEKDETRTVSVLYPKDAADDFQSALNGLQAARIEVPPHMSRAPKEELSILEGELAGCAEEEKSASEEITERANEFYKLSCCCTDLWNIRKAKLEALISGEQTEQMTLLSFWIPVACAGLFKKTVSPYERLMEIAVSEPDEDESPPTLLKSSNVLSGAVEPLITMYGTPAYGGFDPTSIVAPFFYLFFGMCFGDAGYGLLLSSLLILLMMKKRVEGTLKKFLIILTVGNVMSLVVGALTFSWFGDSITSFKFLHFLEPLKSLQILDPMNDPMTFLYISLGLGFFQIMAGLVIAMAENLKKGDKVAAFADQGGWIVFLCGLVLVGLSASGAIGVPSSASGAVAAAGALILVATQGRDKKNVFGKLFSGVMSLYGVTSYLGDVLSYSRLLALGLGSAAVGMVINLLANLVSGVPYVGILLGVVIFALGHTFSIAVNILGAFVHSLRLQYVEFFGKFYSSSGEDFAPLSISTQFVKVSD